MDAWEGMEEAVAVDDAGSFAGAAKLLHVSTSHISKAVAKLEARLDVKLFHRTTRHVELTGTGRAFVDQSRRIIQERDELLAMVGGSAIPQGELRVTCSIALGERFLAPLVREFTATNPKLTVTLDLTNRVIDLIGEGYDLAIRTGQLSDPRLTGRQIALRTIETCASRSYLAAHGIPQSTDDLHHHHCLIGTSSAWHFDVQGEVRDCIPRGRWRCNSGAAVVDAALAGMGICQLPLFYVQEHIRDGRLVPLLEPFRTAPEPIWAVYAARRTLSPKIRNLVDMLERDLQLAIDATE